MLHELQPGDLILDIGANQGAKTETFLQLGARVVAIEPDELNQKILRQKFMKYRFTQKPLTILGKAVSDKRGVETIWIQKPSSAMNTLNRKWVETLKSDELKFGSKFQFLQHKEIDTVTLQDLISTFGAPAFVKIDVEGYEVNVIRRLKSPVKCLSFEVNLPEFRTEGKQCVDLLIHIAEDGIFNYIVDCQRGFVLAEWCLGNEFKSMLDECKETSIEVFWKTTTSHAEVNRR